VISIWTKKRKFESAFESEKIRLAGDDAEVISNISPISGLLGAFITCFESGRNLATRMDLIEGLNKSSVQRSRDSTNKILKSILENNIATDAVRSEVSSIINTYSQIKVNSVDSHLKNNYSVSFVTTVGMYCLHHAVGGTIGNSAYESLKLLNPSLEFIVKNSDTIKIIFSDFPNSSAWLRPLLDKYGAQLKLKV
jgi:hypothetical protein